MSESGFLRRWAQRKAQVAADSQQKSSDLDQAVRHAFPAPSVAPTSRLRPTGTGPEAVVVGAGAGLPPGGAATSAESSIETTPVRESSAAGDAPKGAEPLPALDTLTPADDFSPFMQAGIDAGARNAALRKLFSDPHFNVMDGLDIYIDDYSKPDPMPASMLRALRHARTLGLVDDEPAPSTPLTVSSAQPDAGEGPQPGTLVASDDAESAESAHDHASASPDQAGASERHDLGAEGGDCPTVEQPITEKVVGKEPSL